MNNDSKNFTGLVPITFILGFYVTTCYNRWWNQWKAIPWIGKAAILVQSLDSRQTPEGMLVRWTYMRYTLLGMAITFRSLSSSFSEAYPDMQSLIDAGLVSQDEVDKLERSESKNELPFEWAGEIIRRQLQKFRRGEDEEYIEPWIVRQLNTNLVEWRTSCAILRGFNNHPIPLIYTQLIAFSIYFYFFIALFGRQFFLNKDNLPSTTPLYLDGSPADFYLPWISMIEFLFYISLYKLAGQLYDPFTDTGCEHVLTRVFEEEVSWGRQGCMFVDENWMPDLDPTMVPQLTRGEEGRPVQAVREDPDELIREDRPPSSSLLSPADEPLYMSLPGMRRRSTAARPTNNGNGAADRELGYPLLPQ